MSPIFVTFDRLPPLLLLAAALGGCGGAGLAGGPAAGSRRLPAELQPIAAGTPAPAPAPARGRRRGSHPGPEPCWVLVRAARLPAARSAARTYGRRLASTVVPRENRKPRRPLSKPDTVGADELELNVKSRPKMLKEKHWGQLNSLKADINICSPSVKRRAVTGFRRFSRCTCDILHSQTVRECGISNDTFRRYNGAPEKKKVENCVFKTMF